MVLFPKLPGSFSPRFLYLSMKTVLVVIFIHLFYSLKYHIKVYDTSLDLLLQHDLKVVSKTNTTSI